MEQTLNPNMTLSQAFEAGKRAMRPLFQFSPREEPEGPLMTVRVTGDIGSFNYGSRQYTVEDGKLTLSVAALRWFLGIGVPDGQDPTRNAGRYVLDRAEGEEFATLSFKRGEKIPNAAEAARAQTSAVDKQNQLLEALLSKMAAS